MAEPSSTKAVRNWMHSTSFEDIPPDVKFSHLVGLRAGEAKAKELVRVLKRLDTASNVADVMVQLELPEARIERV